VNFVVPLVEFGILARRGVGEDQEQLTLRRVPLRFPSRVAYTVRQSVSLLVGHVKTSSPTTILRALDSTRLLLQCNSVTGTERGPSMTAARAATRESILEACWQCMVVTGPTNLKIADISREAEVSRVTFYQYFRDRDDVIKATAEHVSDRFYAALGVYMDGGRSFAEQCFRAGEYVCSGKEFEGIGFIVDLEQAALLMTTHSQHLLSRCVDMFASRIDRAKAAGEVRADVPTLVAAEMFARLIFSLVTTPPAYLDMSDPAVVRQFIAQNLLQGWANPA
jgi:AcrR family transcriptional regulator